LLSVLWGHIKKFATDHPDLSMIS